MNVNDLTCPKCIEGVGIHVFNFILNELLMDIFFSISLKLCLKILGAGEMAQWKVLAEQACGLMSGSPAPHLYGRCVVSASNPSAWKVETGG